MQFARASVLHSGLYFVGIEEVGKHALASQHLHSSAPHHPLAPPARAGRGRIRAARSTRLIWMAPNRLLGVILSLEARRRIMQSVQLPIQSLVG